MRPLPGCLREAIQDLTSSWLIWSDSSRTDNDVYFRLQDQELQNQINAIQAALSGAWHAAEQITNQYIAAIGWSNRRHELQQENSERIATRNNSRSTTG